MLVRRVPPPPPLNPLFVVANVAAPPAAQPLPTRVPVVVIPNPAPPVVPPPLPAAAAQALAGALVPVDQQQQQQQQQQSLQEQRLNQLDGNAPLPPPPGPRTRYWLLTIFNLEGPPGTQPNAAAYIDWSLPEVALEFVVRASWQAEICPKTGRFHIQLFYEDKRKHAKHDQVRALFMLAMYQVHLENPYDPLDSYYYCIKGGDLARLYPKWSSDTSRMPGASPHTITGPPPPGRFPGRGGKRDGAGGRKQHGHSEEAFQEMRQLAKSGATLQTWLETPIARQIPVSIQLIKTIRETYEDPFDQYDESAIMRVYCYHGPSRIGKTQGVYRWCKRNGVRLWEAMDTKGVYGDWHERLDGHEAVLYDDFTGNFTDFQALLRALNPIPRIVNKKTGSVIWRPKYIFFTSNKHPKDWTFVFDSPVRREMRDEVSEKEPFMNRFIHGGIYEWKVGLDYMEQEQAPDLFFGPQNVYFPAAQIPEQVRFAPNVPWSYSDDPDLLDERQAILVNPHANVFASAAPQQENQVGAIVPVAPPNASAAPSSNPSAPPLPSRPPAPKQQQQQAQARQVRLDSLFSRAPAGAQQQQQQQREQQQQEPDDQSGGLRFVPSGNVGALRRMIGRRQQQQQAQPAPPSEESEEEEEEEDEAEAEQAEEEEEEEEAEDQTSSEQQKKQKKKRKHWSEEISQEDLEDLRRMGLLRNTTEDRKRARKIYKETSAEQEPDEDIIEGGKGDGEADNGRDLGGYVPRRFR